MCMHHAHPYSSKGVTTMSFRPIPFVISFVLLLAAWVMLTSSFQYQELVAGVIVSIALAITLNSILPKGGKGNLPVRILKAIWFLIVLGKEMIVANLDVAFRVLHPKMPIRPGIVEVKPGLDSEMGKVLLSNSITLTPGTLSMDWIDDRLFIHWINVDEEDVDSSMEPLNKAVKGVFP